MKITFFEFVGAVLAWILFLGFWFGIAAFAYIASFLAPWATWSISLVAMVWVATSLTPLVKTLWWDLGKNRSVDRFDWLRYAIAPMIAPVLWIGCFGVFCASRRIKFNFS